MNDIPTTVDQAGTHGHPSTTVYYTVFVILLLLLVVTVAVAELELGDWNFAAAVTIATIKAGLVLLFFMHIWYSRALIWLGVWLRAMVRLGHWLVRRAWHWRRCRSDQAAKVR